MGLLALEIGEAFCKGVLGKFFLEDINLVKEQDDRCLYKPP